MAKKDKKETPVVAILNMKGGVGKTTISAHVMRVLYLELGKRTLAIDFDPQFNLTQTVITQKSYERLKAANKTILSVTGSKGYFFFLSSKKALWVGRHEIANFERARKKTELPVFAWRGSKTDCGTRECESA